MLVTRRCRYLLGNPMVWFGIPDCQVFLSRNPPVLLVADVSVTVTSYVVASMAKTLSRP
jgi:hypothetical protein